MSMGHTYKFFGFYISYTILTLPLSIFHPSSMLQSGERSLCKGTRTHKGEASQLKPRQEEGLGRVMWPGVECNLNSPLGLPYPKRRTWVCDQLMWQVGEAFPIYEVLHTSIFFNPYTGPSP